MPAHRAQKKPLSIRTLLAAIAVSLLAVAGSIFATSPAFSGFSASINNSNNTIGSGTLLMTETQAAVSCLSSAAGTVTAANAGTCAGINKFGGSTTAMPGVVYKQTVVIKNAGTLPATSFVLTPSGCVATNNGTVNGAGKSEFCGRIDVTLQDDTSTPACVVPEQAGACPTPSSANTLATTGTNVLSLAPLAAGASRTYTFSVMLDTSANNSHMGLTASESLVWSFGS